MLLLFSYLSLVYTVTAVAQEVAFKSFLPPKGSFFPGVGVQDTQGYMWFGSESGLHRYDGYQVITYFNDPLDKNSLSGHKIESIGAGSDGSIWIGTNGFGLDRLDPATGIFTHFPHDPDDPSSLSSNMVTAILEDSEGMIWVGTHTGLNRLDPKTKTFTRYQHNPSDATTISNNQVRSIYEDRQGVLWVGTGSAFIENPERAGGLNRMDRKTGTFTRYLHDPKNPNSLIDNRVRAIFEDSHGTFWIGTAGDGLHTMDRAKGTFERHRYNPSKPGALSRSPLKEVNSWSDDHITFITEDATGIIWIGTLGNGLNRYDPKTKKNTHYPGKKDPLTGDLQVNAWWTRTSRDGILWIGCWGGLFQVDPLRKNIPYYPTGNSVLGIYEDNSGVLWYGVYNTGLIRKNKNGTKQRWKHDPGNPNSLSSNIILSIYQDLQGVLWIGTDNGLNKFNEKSGTFTRYLYNSHSGNDVISNQVWSIVETKEGSLWFATGNGLFRMNRQANTLQRYQNDPKDTNSLSSNRVKRVIKDSSGNLWLGMYLGGVNKLTPQTGKIQRFLKGANVNSMHLDSDGILWVGTSSGLFRSNPALNSFSLFRDPGMEIPANIMIDGILEDDQKTLWLNTSLGILKLSPGRQTLLFYHKNQGTESCGFYKSKRGTLYFGDDKGYFAFSPGQYKGNPRPPQVIISDFRLADQKADNNRQNPLVYPLSQTKQIHLEFDQNAFSFSFSGIHYSNPEQNRHLFQLEGLDDSWRKGGEEKTAYYYNVPPGRYTFRVKASSGDGLWTEKSIVVIVSPPWWRTWWAYTIYVVLLGVVIWRLAGYRSRHLRHELEQRKKEHQLTELKQQKSELQMLVLRAQMNPHFIFNSLNSINRFILENNRDEASEYLTKFSKLVRLILHNSQAALITLESELESMKLYLELECLRFDGQFEFKIQVEDDMDVSMLKVPPLTIQPYAENAIWHGLMHKGSKGYLEIKLWEKDDLLYCRIKDDGIGRKKASELKTKFKSPYKSVGMRITSDRIALLQQQKSIHAAIQINDLVLADGTAGGTEVIIQLPLIYD